MRTADLGTEPVGRLLWGATFQTTMSVATYGIYALTNAWFVSRGVGPVAFAAVSLVSPLLIILGAVASTVGARRWSRAASGSATPSGPHGPPATPSWSSGRPPSP
jgi:hypothetical protein